MNAQRITPENGRLVAPRTDEDSDVRVARLSDGALLAIMVSEVGQSVGNPMEFVAHVGVLSTKLTLRQAIFDESTGSQDLSDTRRACTDTAADVATALADHYVAVNSTVRAALRTPEAIAAFAEAMGFAAIGRAFTELCEVVGRTATSSVAVFPHGKLFHRNDSAAGPSSGHAQQELMRRAE